jgi:hypothetical protein
MSGWLRGIVLGSALAACTSFGSAPPSLGAGGQDAGLEAGPDAGMGATPITFVKVLATDFNGKGSGTLTLPAVAPHDALIVPFEYATDTDLVSVTDSAGDSFTLVPNPPHRRVDGTRRGIAAAFDVKGGTTDITVKITLGALPPPVFFTVYAHEYAGIVPTNAIDLMEVNDVASKGELSLTSGIGTTSAPHELVFAFATGSGLQPGANFTQRSTYNQNLTEDREVLSAGPYEATATAETPADWIMLMATFRGR